MKKNKQEEKQGGGREARGWEGSKGVGGKSNIENTRRYTCDGC